MDLLILLARSPNETVCKQTIFDTLWGDVAVQEGALIKCVSELRSALDDDPSRPRIIQTRYGRGYRLIASVEAATQSQDEVDRSDRRRWPNLRRLALGLVATGLMLVVITWRRANDSGEPQTGRTATRAVVIGLKSLSNGVDDAWIGEAAAHLLTAELVAVTDLRMVPREVISRSRRELPFADGAAHGDAALLLRDRLAIDYVFGGHYVVADGPDGLRLDLTVTDGTTGEIVAAVVENGSRNDLPRLVTHAALALRDALGLAEPSGRGARIVQLADATLPAGYYRALEHFHRYETAHARVLLERAVTAAAASPWPRLALAEAWSRLGYDRRAADVVPDALARSTALVGEEKLWFEARAHVLAERLPEAIERFEALTLLAPGNLEYRLALATTRLSAGRVEEAHGALGQLDQQRTAARDPRLLIVAGEAALGLGNPQRAISLARTALARCRSLRAQAAEGRALFLMARAQFLNGQIRDAEATLEHARDRFVLARDRSGEARAAATLSQWLEGRGEVARAEQEARAALAVSRAINDRSGEAEALRLLGPQLWQQGAREEGEAAIRRALAIARERDDLLAEAATLNALAVAVARWSGGKPRSHFERALSIYRQLGNRSGVRDTLMNLGRLALLEGRHNDALGAYREAEALVGELDPESRGLLSFNLGYLRLVLGQLDAAAAAFQVAVQLFHQLENSAMLAASMEGLGSTALLAGDLPRAVALLWSALRIRQRLAHPVRTARSEVALARAYIELGQIEEAEVLLRAAIDRSEGEGGHTIRPVVLEAWARLHLASGTIEPALEVVEAFDRRTTTLSTVSGASRQATLARVLSAAGRHSQAAERIARALAYLEASDAIVMQLDARVAAIEIGHAAGVPIERSELLGLEKQARDHGLALLVAHIRNLRTTLQSAARGTPSPGVERTAAIR